MGRNRVGLYAALSAVGAIVFGVGLALAALLQDGGTLPYVCVGLGAGILGGSLGRAVHGRAARKDPQLAREAETARKDERGQIIRDKAKARAYDLMVCAYAVMLLVFALLRVEAFVLLAMVAVYLAFILANAGFAAKYHKEM